MAGILPKIAVYAAIIGDARYMFALGLPILPKKFLFIVDSILVLSAGIGPCVPKHDPHPGGVKIPPAFIIFSMYPSFNAFI